jgi:uncharacterized protein (DUF1778 family)
MRAAAKRTSERRRPTGGADPRATVERKTARMELRLTPSSKKVIDRAVSLSGLAPGDLAFDAARRILEEHERFALQDADRDAFVDAITDPPRPTPRLIAAFTRHRKAIR